MIDNKIISFARENGYDTALPLGKWKKYDAYEPVMAEAVGGAPAPTGPPLMILVCGEEIRMSTPEEAYEQLDSITDDSEIE